MSTNVLSSNVFSRRPKQIVAWIILGILVSGFFLQQVGFWTGTILGVWFVGTQKPLRGFIWMMALSFIPSLISEGRLLWPGTPLLALESIGWLLLTALFSVLPFTVSRLIGPRLPGAASTLAFPFAAAVLRLAPMLWVPASFWAYVEHAPHASMGLLRLLFTAPYFSGVAGLSLFSLELFLRNWIAAGVVWMWNQEFRGTRARMGGMLFCILVVAYTELMVYGRSISIAMRGNHFASIVSSAYICLCFAGLAALSAWAIVIANRHRSWASDPETIRILQSPYSGEELKLIRQGNQESLASASGERFAIRRGIAVMLKPEELTGQNLKYNHLYETIGGFYDDTQRVVVALSGMDRDAYMMSYLGFLEAKPGDRVLETSVGTGLNYKFLPPGVKLYGLDLSNEMLINCQANLRRWDLDAKLILGSAELLPFADSSFDVVFHVGGINFFSDRGKAIREMIRVAKPGSRILIADETEEHVRGTYEHTPVVAGYFKHRNVAVTAPVDLVPEEMLEIRLDTLENGRFYALTFRKPAAA